MLKKALAVSTIALATNYGMALETPTISLKKHNVVSCMACSTAMDAVDWLINADFVEKFLIEVSKVVCIWFKLALTPVEICPQLVPQLGYVLFPVIS